MPVLSRDAAAEALGRLTPPEIERALKDRVLPIFISPGRLAYAAARNRVPPRGLEVVAVIPGAELLWALQQRFGRRLMKTSVDGLSAMVPGMSATGRAGARFAILCGALLLLVSMCFVWQPAMLDTGVRIAFLLFFALVVAIKFQAILVASAAEAPRTNSPGRLPVYSVLVPLFRETSVLTQLMRGLEALDYPRNKLDIKLILEESDAPMRAACAALRLPDHIEIIVVPGVGPQTKPKALNYALQLARGELVTIFDAEDIPDPDQLRLAAAAFAAAPPEMACFQARLHFYNPMQSWLTRQFALEYAALFDFILPALERLSVPIPLGGTSNHFRADILRRIGAWDAYNVTEDADLGLRIARLGYETATLASTTEEEATSRYGNWLRQRARWQKGYLKTWLVHMRSPAALWNDLGAARFLAVQAVLLGTFLSALLHPLFLALFISDIARGTAFPQDGGLLKIAAGGSAAAILLAGYGTGIALGMRAALRIGSRRLLISALATPAYWLLISAASWLGLWDLLVRPYHWHKTEHGHHIQRRGRARSPYQPPRAPSYARPARNTSTSL